MLGVVCEVGCVDLRRCGVWFLFFLKDAAPPESYPLSLPHALPISPSPCGRTPSAPTRRRFWSARWTQRSLRTDPRSCRSEAHTSELQSRQYLVCRLLLENKHKRPPHSRRVVHHPLALLVDVRLCNR